MKNLLLILVLIPFLSSAQISSPCTSNDTLLYKPHNSDYTYNRTRGLTYNN